MGWLGEMWRRLGGLLRGTRLDRDLEDEMRLHVDLKAQKLIESGVEPDEARYRAQREFGNALRLKERSQEVWQWRPFEEIAQDLRFAFRMLRRSPGFTAGCGSALGVGGGGETNLFTPPQPGFLMAPPGWWPEAARAV